MKPEVLAEPILVGREHELEVLNQFLDDAIAGKGSTVFVSGDAGSGKTRLAQEFLKSARERGVRVLSGWCLSNAAVPYFPFIEAFEAFPAQNESDQPIYAQQLGLKTWLMGANQAEGLSPQAWRDLRFAGVTKELLFISTDKPLILFIDDLHWADSASLALLHYVARVIHSERILILCTFRTEELGTTAEGFARPLLDTLRLMSREDLFKEVKLPNLSPSDIGRIAENMLGGEIHEEFVQKLADESRGNPLFVVESIRMLFENGGLSPIAGKWRISLDKLSIPIKVKDIILRRLSLLKPEQRRVLDVASVIGDKFDPQLLGLVFNVDSLEILETLNSIALSNSLICVEGDCYRFDHARTREVLYDEIFLPLKKGYHERVAERLEILKAKQLPIADLAYHYSQAGNTQKSVQYSLEAGKDALARFSNSEALKNFSYVVKTVAANSEYFNERITALEGVGDSLFASGRFEDAIKSYDQFVGQVASETAKLRVLRKTMLSAYWRGNRTFAMETAAKAERYATANDLEYARLRLYRGFIAGREGKTEEALNDVEGSLRVFENECSLLDLASALVEISFLYPFEDRLEDAVSCALRAVALCSELNDLRALELAHNRLGAAFSYSGLVHEALDSFSKAIKIGEKICDSNSIAFDCFMAAQIYEVQHDFNAAVQYSLKGALCAEKTDAHYAQSLCYENLVREYIFLGDIAHAKKYGKKLENLFNQSADLRTNLQATAWMSNVCLYMIRNQWEEAYSELEKALSSPMPKMMHSNVKALQAWLLSKQGRYQEAQAESEEAQRMAGELIARFQNCHVQAFIAVKKEAFVGEELHLRLDIVNVGKAHAQLARIEGLVPFTFRVSPSFVSLIGKNGAVDLGQKRVGGFSTETVSLMLTPTKAGVFKLNAKLSYVDDKEKSNEFEIKPITIIVKPKLVNTKKESFSGNAITKLEFNSEAARKAFDYLLIAFMEDSQRQKLPIERCGWRTMMEIVRQGKVSKYSIYGSKRNFGKVIKELQHKHVIEIRIFTSERGRGGEISKVRVNCENVTVQSKISGLTK